MAPKRPCLSDNSDSDIEIIEVPRKKAVCQPTPARTPVTPATPARTPAKPVVILDDDDDDLEIIEVRSALAKRPAPTPAPLPAASPATIYADNAALLGSARRAALAPAAAPIASRRVSGVHTLADLPDYNADFNPPAPVYQPPAAPLPTPTRRKPAAPKTKTPSKGCVQTPTTASCPIPRSRVRYSYGRSSTSYSPEPRAPAAAPAVTPATPAASAPRRPSASSAAASNRNKDSPSYRPKRFRPHCPAAVAERLSRALSQRLIVLSRSGYSPTTYSETFTMAGTTGNVYTIKICDIPTCDCPDAKKGNTCKHLLYVMARVLGAREGLVYQAGLTREEVEEVFSRPGAQGAGLGNSAQGSQGAVLGTVAQRKPISDQDPCPICFSEITSSELENGELLYCRAQCGANVHKECFGFWRRTKGTDVTCVLCRQAWVEEVRDGAGLEEVLRDMGGHRVEEGYLNVAEELGISGQRDTSSYYAGPGGFGRRGRERYGWRVGLF
ncbi:hypothetical protein FPQ18DRAFT_415829 [Pyronema domesticum]|nr:hypothetical protein FPQ18DRAFT_415829 [Pyronema domesticum]